MIPETGHEVYTLCHPVWGLFREKDVVQKLHAALGLFGIIGAAAWIALASVLMPEWGPPGTGAYERYEASAQLWVFAFGLMACGFVGFIFRFGLGATRLGKIGAGAIVIGFLAMMAGNAAEFRIFTALPYAPDNARTGAWLTLLAGLLVVLVGIFMLGVDSMQRSLLPQWMSVLLVSVLPATILSLAWSPLMPLPLCLTAVAAGGLAMWPALVAREGGIRLAQ